MSRIAVALGSFILGAFVMFFLVGKPPSTLAQSGADRFSNSPRVPPLFLIVSDRSFSGETLELDGTHFKDCQFGDVTLSYSGGSFRFENVTVTGPVRINLRGPAANAVALLQTLSEIEANKTPQPWKAYAPIQKGVHAPGQPVRVSLSSPFLGVQDPTNTRPLNGRE